MRRGKMIPLEFLKQFEPKIMKFPIVGMVLESRIDQAKRRGHPVLEPRAADLDLPTTLLLRGITPSIELVP